jgi:predicted amidophosphoribosyltransferase
VKVLAPLLGVLFPARCVGCGAAPAALCPGCLARARPAPVAGADAAPPPGLDWWVAAFAYDGAVREALARVKYRNARSALPGLAAVLADRLRGPAAGPVDVVTWAPTTAARRRQRGFDQAEHLARAVGPALGVPVRGCLARRAGAAQTGRSAGERRRGPVFTVRAGAGAGAVAGRRVLLVDDVATTGATLVAAARALRAAGAEAVGAATVARTPRRPPPGTDRSPPAQGVAGGRRYQQ